MQGKTINGYTLQHLLGMGGMAEVWYAENAIGKKAAVKLLLPKFCNDEAIVARFENEAKVMVQLDHPNIRQVYDYGSIDVRPSIVMEYLEGEDLKALMKSGRRFTDAELRKWWDQIADALNYTHAQGVVHRDIKPSNIFLDKKGNIKLLDFGIAKIRESISMTQTGAMMGTLMYMSPEQVRDSKHIGPESDAYSLAVSFVHMITGKKPYDSDTTSDYDIRKGIVEIPLDLTGVPADWQAFLRPYLEKDPAQRAALKHFEADAPGSDGFAIRPTGNGDLQSPVEDEGTMVSNDSSPKSAPKETLSNGNRHSGPSFRENGTLSPEPKDKPKSKKGLWIGLAVAAVGVILALILLIPKSNNGLIEPQDNNNPSLPHIKEGSEEYQDAQRLYFELNKVIDEAQSCDELKAAVESALFPYVDKSYADNDRMTPEEEEEMERLGQQLDENLLKKFESLGCE